MAIYACFVCFKGYSIRNTLFASLCFHVEQLQSPIKTAVDIEKLFEDIAGQVDTVLGDQA